MTVTTIVMTLKIGEKEKAYLRGVLYSEMKRITDQHDHARAHGDHLIDPNFETLRDFINQFEYGQ